MDALNVVFRHMDPSPAVEARIRTHVERLEQIHGRITTGQVVVEAPHRHNRQGRLFTVRLRLSTPGRQVVVADDGGRKLGRQRGRGGVVHGRDYRAATSAPAARAALGPGVRRCRG